MKTTLGRREFLSTSTLAAGSIALGAPSKPWRIGVGGQKHTHVNQVLTAAASDLRATLVALVDDDPKYRQEIVRVHGKSVRYTNHRDLLAGEELDAVMRCEDYGHRGEAVIAHCVRVNTLFATSCFARERRN